MQAQLKVNRERRVNKYFPDVDAKDGGFTYASATPGNGTVNRPAVFGINLCHPLYLVFE